MAKPTCEATVVAFLAPITPHDLEILVWRCLVVRGELPIAFPHDDGKGFDVMLQALPLHDNGKIVLREHEPKDHEEDESADDRRKPAGGRNGESDRNAPRNHQRR
jgi:hypothetical protein